MAKNLLQQHFPMLQTRSEVEKLIYSRPALRNIFLAWSEERQKEFLDFCTGERGERSTKEFHQFPTEYLHYFTQKSDTGLELNLLQEYYFVPLDIFRENIQNKGIQTKLDAWLTFLISDEPDMIMELIQTFPEFKPLYEDIYELCRNVEGVMNMFSKELRELDRNTVQYMIDVMQDEIDVSKKLLTEKDQLLKQQALETQLYAKLNEEGRHVELGRAFSDVAFRKQLLEEYHLQ